MRTCSPITEDTTGTYSFEDADGSVYIVGKEDNRGYRFMAADLSYFPDSEEFSTPEMARAFIEEHINI